MSGNDSDQNMDRAEDTENPPAPASEPANGERPTRSITVSIQYSYFNPNGLANLNPNQPNGNAEGNGETPTVNRPDGALILSFRDVPTSTRQERLESIISIAAELAMRRFSDMMSQPKGITKEQFEQLPALKVRELADRHNTICSICYDAYEDELSNIFKRTREDDLDGRDGLQKKQRSESPVVVPTEQSSSQQDENTEQAPNVMEPPTYKHSPVVLPCNHVFGRECLFKWSQLENSCPLCRHKIVEAAAGQSGEDSNGAVANQNAEAFERIRQALYNPSAPDQQTEGPTSTNAGNDLHNFTFSRSGIVLLRPDTRAGLATGEAGAQTENENGATATNEGTGEQSDPTPLNSINSPDSRRIQWIPLPITAIQLPTSLNNENNDDTNDGESAPSGRPANERLRSILNNIFNSISTESTASESAERTASTPTLSTTESSTSSASQSNTPPVPRRRSFLDHILRITNRHRNRSDSNNTESGSLPIPHPQASNSMFNTGVASYRNPDGQVSTFHVSDGPLPLPPRNNQSTRNSNSGNEDETHQGPSQQTNGDAASGSND